MLSRQSNALNEGVDQRRERRHWAPGEGGLVKLVGSVGLKLRGEGGGVGGVVGGVVKLVVRFRGRGEEGRDGDFWCCEAVGMVMVGC